MSKPGEQTGKPECIWCGMKPFRHFGFEMFCEEARVGHKYTPVPSAAPVVTEPLHFDSTIQRVGMLPEFNESVVKNEPMLFNCSGAFAYENGGPITRAFMNGLPSGFHSDIVIDSRVHMLMTGWYPCIPGWHLDDVPRTRPDGQPDHACPSYEAEHVMAVVGDASLTEFAVGRASLPDVPIGGGVIYGKWNVDIENFCTAGRLLRKRVEDRLILRFNWQSFHRGMPATKNGWRFFIRATRNTQRKTTDEIRRQVQVYLPEPEAGW